MAIEKGLGATGDIPIPEEAIQASIDVIELPEMPGVAEMDDGSAIVGTPIDAVDLMGRVGETALRGAAKAGEGIIGALGSDEGMAKRFGRDIYGLGIAASTLAPMAVPRP